MFPEIYTYLLIKGTLSLDLSLKIFYNYHRLRVESLVVSIQISTLEQNRTMLSEPVALFINVKMVCVSIAKIMMLILILNS